MSIGTTYGALERSTFLDFYDFTYEKIIYYVDRLNTYNQPLYSTLNRGAYY